GAGLGRLHRLLLGILGVRQLLEPHQAVDLRLQLLVLALCRRQVAVRAGELVALQHEDGEQSGDDDGGDHAHHDGELARLQTLPNIGGKEVYLSHSRPPGRARPTATASSGSAAAMASGDRSRDGFTRWNACPGATCVARRSSSRFARPGSLEPPPVTRTREIFAPLAWAW